MRRAWGKTRQFSDTQRDLTLERFRKQVANTRRLTRRLPKAESAFLPRPVLHESFRKTFNTATVQFAVNGRFEASPLTAGELERFLAAGFVLPKVDVPDAIAPFAERWWAELREEMEPLAGKRIDKRFVGSVWMQ